MKSYLNAKLILFKNILKKKSLVVSDKEIKQFKILKRISKKRGLKIVDINIEYSKVKKSLTIFFKF